MKINSVFTKTFIFLVFPLGSLLLSGCKKLDVKNIENEPSLASNNLFMNDGSEVLNGYNGLTDQTLWELKQARSGTARYRKIENALADGYTDIHVVVPNMGYHFMKSENVDAKFEIRSPEILVYNKNLDGKFELVAVEYAVPISLSPDAAPEGFTGSDDVWDRNTTFGLWLQHGWIWSFNPDGVFHDTNPLITVL